MRYDAISRLIESINPKGQKQSISYDNNSRIITTTNALSDTTQYAYDANGNLVQLIDARGNSTIYQYDSRDRLISSTDSKGQTGSQQYDSNNNITQTTDRNGQITQYQYDELDRLMHISYHDGSSLSQTYDAYSRVNRINDSISGISSYKYDEAGRVIVQNSQNGSIRYQYNSLGQLSQKHTTGQDPINYQYDANGRLSSINLSNNPLNINLNYDSRNQLQQISRANGINTDYQNDVRGQLLSISHKNTSHGIIAEHNYTLNSLGQRTEQQSNLDQPLTTQADSYNIDINSNQLQNQNSVSYQYDLNGNRISKTDQSGTTTYQWDVRNRLQSINYPDSSADQFIYDSNNDLIQKDHSDSQGNNSSEYYLIDLQRNITQINSSTETPTQVISGNSIDSHLATIQNNDTQYIHTDGQNSTTATTDQNGNLINTNQYTPYGITESTNTNHFQYTGRQKINDSLYYYRARFYDPKAGRFISEDPIGLRGGDVNFYGYVLGDPVNFIDPLGLYWGINQSYVQGQIDALSQLGQLWLGTAIGVGTVATAPTVVPAVISGGRALACYGAETAVATSPFWGNPRVQQGTIDLISSMIPGAPAQNGLGLLGFGTGVITNPHEFFR